MNDLQDKDSELSTASVTMVESPKLHETVSGRLWMWENLHRCIESLVLELPEQGDARPICFPYLQDGEENNYPDNTGYCDKDIVKDTP